MNKTIIFFYPSKIVGGAEYLFMRSAVYLSEVLHCKVKYIDYEDGFVAKQLKSIEVIPYNDYFKVKVPKNSIVICPLSSVFDIVGSLKGDFSIFFWSIHPVGLHNAIKSYLRFSNVKEQDLFMDVQVILDRRAIAFMDGANLDYQRDKFKFVISKEDFLPIFCLRKDELEVPKKEVTDVVHLGWLGRLCIEKANPLINVLSHLKEYAISHIDKKFVFHIIGEGEEEYRIKKENLPSNVEVVFLGTLVGKELDNYIYQKIDVMFGMGTSTLEIASLQKAVVLVDFSFKEMSSNNSFRWLYESERFSVGDEYKVESNYKHSFSDLIRLIENNQLGVVEKRCYNYFIDNHTEDSVCNHLMEKANNSNLTNEILRRTHFGKFKFIGLLKKINHFRRNLLK